MPRTKIPVYHKYERFYWPNKKPYYKCMVPGCPHYLPIVDLAVGRESMCWGPGCNRLVTITREDIARGIKHPMCDDCKKERLERREELIKQNATDH